LTRKATKFILKHTSFVSSKQKLENTQNCKNYNTSLDLIVQEMELALLEVLGHLNLALTAECRYVRNSYDWLATEEPSNWKPDNST